MLINKNKWTNDLKEYFKWKKSKIDLIKNNYKESISYSSNECFSEIFQELGVTYTKEYLRELESYIEYLEEYFYVKEKENIIELDSYLEMFKLVIDKGYEYIIPYLKDTKIENENLIKLIMFENYESDINVINLYEDNVLEINYEIDKLNKEIRRINNEKI